MIRETDILIVGAGIIGLTLAKELIAQGVDRIILLEKEADLGCHASGRNSGVLHAGIYYSPNTLKAELCLKGNLMLQDYCIQKSLPLKKTGKVIVARNKLELSTLHQLYERAKINGAYVELIDENQLNHIEPNAKTFQKALYSHYTAVVDSVAILKALQQDLINSKKVTLLFNTQFRQLKNDYTIKTSNGLICFKYFFNTAGAYADKIAHQFGIAKNYYFIPFKGIYQKLIAEKAHLVNGNIYPVPNLDNPFLGVHFTKNIFGDVYVGPTAIPAFGRENYGFFQGIDRELLRIILNECILFCVNSEFRSVAVKEPRKYMSRYFFQDAKNLVKELQSHWLKPTMKIGIRPQLINISDKKLIMDFLILKEGHSFHVLNAISPAFTSSLAFAKYILKEYFSTA